MLTVNLMISLRAVAALLLIIHTTKAGTDEISPTRRSSSSSVRKVLQEPSSSSSKMHAAKSITDYEEEITVDADCLARRGLQEEDELRDYHNFESENQEEMDRIKQKEYYEEETQAIVEAYDEEESSEYNVSPSDQQGAGINNAPPKNKAKKATGPVKAAGGFRHNGRAGKFKKAKQSTQSADSNKSSGPFPKKIGKKKKKESKNSQGTKQTKKATKRSKSSQAKHEIFEFYMVSRTQKKDCLVRSYFLISFFLLLQIVDESKSTWTPASVGHLRVGSKLAFQALLADDEEVTGSATGYCTVDSEDWSFDLTSCDIFLELYTYGEIGYGSVALRGTFDMSGGRFEVKGTDHDFVETDTGHAQMVFDPDGSSEMYTLLELTEE